MQSLWSSIFAGATDEASGATGLQIEGGGDASHACGATCREPKAR